MEEEHNVLIVGAGPSGMVCALSLLQQGIPVRIIEKRKDRDRISKATGVSLGTIKALSMLGISQDITRHMIPMQRFVFYEDNKLVSNLNIPTLNGEPPAYLYPQAKLEKIIENKLNAIGCHIEYGTSISNIHPPDSSQRVIVELELSNGLVQEETFQWVIGADGAHSTVREIARFDFGGKDYPESWSVSEIKTDDWDSSIQAKLFLGSDGIGLFLSNPEPGIVQGIQNAHGAGNRLMEKFPGARINYERTFNVSLKRVYSPRKGNIWLIGDAAHIQSPVGGQGLNLAIADSFVLSRWLLSNEDYVERKLSDQSRRTLFFTDFDYQMLSTRSMGLRAIRNQYWSLAARMPVISRWFFKSISGLKHYKGTEIV